MATELEAFLAKRPVIEYVTNSCFDDPRMEAIIMGPMPDEADYLLKKSKMKLPESMTPEMAPAYEWPLLNREQEYHLFRKMNYLKHRAMLVRIKFTNEYERLAAQALVIQKQLVSSNYRLALSLVKKMSIDHNEYFDAVAEAMFPLMNSIVKFDYSLGNKFSTYGSWSIIKWGYRYHLPPKLTAYTNIEKEYFIEKGGTEPPDYIEAEDIELRNFEVDRYLNQLDPREKEIIQLRNGLGPASPTGKETWTLEQIGSAIGITKERVRQLQDRAYRKIRGKRPKLTKSKRHGTHRNGTDSGERSGIHGCVTRRLVKS